MGEEGAEPGLMPGAAGDLKIDDLGRAGVIGTGIADFLLDRVERAESGAVEVELGEGGETTENDAEAPSGAASSDFKPRGDFLFGEKRIEFFSSPEGFIRDSAVSEGASISTSSPPSPFKGNSTSR